MALPTREGTGFGDPIGLAKSSKELAVVTDEQGRVVYWNNAAAKLFGRKSDSVSGELFPEVVDGRDVFSNRMFHEPGRFLEIVERGEALQNFAFDVRSASGDLLRVAASVLVVLGPESSRYRLLYRLRPQPRRRRTDVLMDRLHERFSEPHRPAPKPPPLNGLTRRQLQVLGRIARGQSTREISDSLGITVNTVRSHSQAVLSKLGAHSRAEAVALALRRGLL